jgi:mono/diheme cytochrome c family protein
MLLIGVEIVVAGIVVWLLRPSVERRFPGAGRAVNVLALVAVVLGSGIAAVDVATDRTPLSGRANPIPRTVDSIAMGAGIFQANCATCHGVDGRGGGELSGSTRVTPPSLVSGHLNSHADGDLFYWISEGLPGGMPGFATRLGESDRWQVINYLRSLNRQAPVAR